MKPAAFTGMLLLLMGTASAQLSFLPQIGFDRSGTKIMYNDQASFSPSGPKSFFKGSVRIDYKFRKGHGPFIGIGTSPAPLEFSFSNPSTAKTNYTTSFGSARWKLEAGYMYTTKPIQFKKNSRTISRTSANNSQEKKSCGSYTRYCGPQKKQSPARQAKPLNLRLQPSVGMAYLPNVAEDISLKGTSYQYMAGNFRTGLVTGLGFELGQARQRIMTLSVYYTKGIGNLDTRTITRVENGKQVTTRFSSATSSWGLSLGIPITASKTRKPAVKKEQKPSCQQRYQYRSNCVKRI